MTNSENFPGKVILFDPKFDAVIKPCIEAIKKAEAAERLALSTRLASDKLIDEVFADAYPELAGYFKSIDFNEKTITLMHKLKK